MRTHTKTTRVVLGAALLAGVWAFANAGPIDPDDGPASPTPETLQTINTKIDQVIDALGTPTVPDPESGLSAFVSMVNGETMSGRVFVEQFVYEIDSPFQSSPGGSGFTRTALGDVRMVLSDFDSAFLPFFFAGLDRTRLDVVQVDLCPLGGVPGQLEDCPMSIELFGVVIERSEVLGDDLGQAYTLSADSVRTTYRRPAGGGQQAGTFVHGYDFANNRPI